MAFVPGALAQEQKQYSMNSMIVNVDGRACLGQEHSRVETEKLALAAAKRAAAERALTMVSCTSTVKSGELVEDLLSAYSKASVRIIKEEKRRWDTTEVADGCVDSCYSVNVMAEVIPAKMPKPVKAATSAMDDPRAPLTVELWTDKDVYSPGDHLKFYFRGNKPFYVRGVYKDAEGNMIEVTPFYRSRSYLAGITYMVPDDRAPYRLVVVPPFGKEKLILYASTHPIALYPGKPVGNFYLVDKTPDLGKTTRSLTVLKFTKEMQESHVPLEKVEFAEVAVPVVVHE